MWMCLTIIGIMSVCFFMGGKLLGDFLIYIAIIMIIGAGILLVAFSICRSLQRSKKEDFRYQCAKRAEEIKEKIKVYNRSHESMGVIFTSTKMCMWITIEYMNPPVEQQ